MQLCREMILIHVCDENDSQENSLFSYFDMSNDDTDNDDVIEAKSPVLKSKLDKKIKKTKLKDSHSFMTTIKYK